MSKQFTTCPQCGAMGEIGANCEFCGALIEAKDNSTVCNELIPQRRTISSVEFAKKVSIFHNVGNFTEGIAVARIGQLNGVINLNGDLVLPLEYYSIDCDSDERYLLIKTQKTKYGINEECHLVLLNDNRRMISIPRGPEHLKISRAYSLMADYNNSILRHGEYERLFYYRYDNLETKAVLYFTMLFEYDHQCYVSPQHAKVNAKANNEHLTEPGIYDIQTWTLVRKLSIDDEQLKKFYYSTASVDSFLSTYNELIDKQREDEQKQREKEAREKLEGNIFYRIFAGIGRAIGLVFRIIFDLIGL